MSNERRSGSPDNWFRSLIGNVILRFAGGLALLCLVCLLFGIGDQPWWIWIVGMAISGLIALAGDKMRTRTVYVDPDTGHAIKRNL